MNTNQKNIGIGFWLLWVLASALGFGVGAVLATFILIFARVPEGIAFPILFGVIIGAVGSLAQWMVMRGRAPEVGLWVPFSAVAFMLAVVTAANPNVSPDFNPLFILAGIYGLLGGFLQGLILEKRGVPIGWWIAASVIGGMLGGAMNSSTIAAVSSNEAWQIGTMTFFSIWFRLGAPIGLGLGITTGAALLWFMRNPKSGRMADAARQSAQ